jgi:uncharacterized protein (TIGR02996 family)
MFEEYPDAAGFLDAIRAAPDDVTSRLVFSDWLEERGDLRCAWLREPDLWPWMEPDLHDPVAALLLALSEGRWRLWNAARDTLAKLGTPGVAAVRAWMEEAPDARWSDTRGMIEATRPPVLRSVDELNQALKAPTWYVQWLAIVDLGWHGPAAAEVVGTLLKFPLRAESSNTEALEGAIFRALGRIGAAAARAIPRLCEALRHPGEVVEQAAEGLRGIGRQAPDELLDHVFASDGRGLFERSLRILAEVHPDGLGVLDGILRAEVNFHQGVMIALKIVSSHADEAAELVPALMEAIQRPVADGDHTVRLEIARTLVKIGAPARVALPTLRAVHAEYAGPILSQAHAVRAAGAIAVALAKLDDPGTGLEALLSELNATSPHHRAHAVALLVDVATVVPEAITHLSTALDDPDEFVRSATLRAMRPLLTLGQNAEKLLPLLFRALADPGDSVRARAVSALERLRSQPTQAGTPLDEQIVERLLVALVDPSITVSLAALDALNHGTLPPWVAGPMLDYLRHPLDDFPVNRVFQILGRVVEFPADLVPDVVALRNGDRPGIAVAATRLLQVLRDSGHL